MKLLRSQPAPPPQDPGSGGNAPTRPPAPQPENPDDQGQDQQ